MTAPELKPCPFCGASASYSVTSDDGQQNEYDTVGCSACPAEMRIILHWADDDGKNKADLLSAWNRRADLAAVQPAQVRVKPLVWEEPCYTNNWIHVARSVLGDYYVSIDGGRHSAWLEANVKPYENKIGDDVGSAIEAMMLAETDYQARMQPLITPHPDPRDEVIAVKVKPLVWGDYPNRAFASPDVAVAEAPFSHRYQVQRDPWANSFMAYLHPTAPIGSSTLWWESKGHPTLNDAKTAAQADYDARIMSAVDVQPDLRDEVIARLVDALERIGGVRGPYSFPFPEADLDYGSFAVVEARAALAAAKAVMK